MPVAKSVRIARQSKGAQGGAYSAHEQARKYGVGDPGPAPQAPNVPAREPHSDSQPAAQRAARKLSAKVDEHTRKNRVHV